MAAVTLVPGAPAVTVQIASSGTITIRAATGATGHYLLNPVHTSPTSALLDPIPFAETFSNFPNGGFASVYCSVGTVTYELDTFAGDLSALQSQINAIAAEPDPLLSELQGQLSTANVVTGSGANLETRLLAIEQAVLSVPSVSDPAVTTAPSLAGTKTVGQTLTITPGAVTDGSGGAHTNLYTFYRVNASNVAAPIQGAVNQTGLTYVLSSVELGFFIFVTHQARDTVTGRLSVAVPSALTTIITGTVPTNSVAPAITPSGTQTAGTVLTMSSGTWSVANCTFGYLFYDNGIAIGTRSATATCSTTGREGHSITGDVIATTPLFVPSGTSGVAASNTVTIAGAPSVVMTTAPVLPDAAAGPVIYSGFNYAITPATMTVGGVGTTPSSRTWHFVLQARAGFAENDYAQNTTPLYNVDDFSGVAGRPPSLDPYPLQDDTVKIREMGIVGGLAYQFDSVAYTINPPPAVFTATVQIANPTFTVGSLIQPTIPVTFSGNTGPVVKSINPGQPTGTQWDSSTGAISGTPTNPGSYPATITGIDDAGPPGVSGNVTITINAASGGGSTPSPTDFVHADQLFANADAQSSAQLLGQFPAITSIVESGIHGTGTVLGSTLRFGKKPDPLNSSRTVLRQALRRTDPFTAGNVWRCDVQVGLRYPPLGVTVWSCEEIYIPSLVYFVNDDHALWNVHPGGAGNGAIGYSINRGVFTYIRVTGGTGSAVVVQVSQANAPPDTWLKIVRRYRISNGGDGFCTLWINGVQVVNDSGSNGVNEDGHYEKHAFYQTSDWAQTGTPEQEIMARSYSRVFTDAEGANEPNMRAKLV